MLKLKRIWQRGHRHIDRPLTKAKLLPVSACAMLKPAQRSHAVDCLILGILDRFPIRPSDRHVLSL